MEHLNSFIDQTILRPDAKAGEVEAVCREAAGYGFPTVFVHPAYVPLAVAATADREIRIGTTCGFPFGQNTTGVKVEEARTAVEQGAREIDMVLNISWLKSGMLPEVLAEIGLVVEGAKGAARGDEVVIVKVIIECGLLGDEEKIAISSRIGETGADFLKTSTGFLGMGATVEDVRLLRANAPAEVGVKASGGIRSLDQAMSMIDAGAARIGTSAGVSIMDEWLARRRG